jgi:hypothetical protein
MAHALLCEQKIWTFWIYRRMPGELNYSSTEDYCPTSGPTCSFPNADVSGLFIFLYHATLIMSYM